MKPIFALAAAAAIACAGPAWAHHSHANYLQNRPVTLSGRVTELHWLNPHTWIYMEITNPQGQKRVWTLEGTGTAGLIRQGWTKDSIKPNDMLSVRCFPLRDGADGCLMGFVTSLNGVAMDKEFN